MCISHNVLIYMIIKSYFIQYIENIMNEWNGTEATYLNYYHFV